MRIVIFLKKVYPPPIVILPFSQRKSESTIFGSSRCSDSHEQLMELKKKGKNMSRYSAPMHWKYSIFAVNEWRRFHEVAELWSLLRGITFRTIWIEMKDAIFYDQKWRLQKVKSVIWKSLLDYDRVAWERYLWIVMKSLIAKYQSLRSFDKVWCASQVICKRDGKHIGWFLDGLQRGFIS